MNNAVEVLFMFTNVVNEPYCKVLPFYFSVSLSLVQF